MVKTPSKTLANKILHGLQDLGYKSTTYILKNITDDTAPRQQVLKVCHLLKAAGKLKSFGTGKISWAVTVSSWDESNPFSGLPEDNSQISYSKPFAAKFPGWCSVCDKEIVAGQQICIKRDQHDKKTSLHAECVDKPQQVEVKVPADSVELSDAVKGFDALTKRLGDLVKEVESLKANQPPRVIEIVKPDKSTTKLEERVHPIFEQVLFHVQCGDNVELVGPTGCGKSVLAEQVARALELPFGFVSMSDGVTESRLFGRVTPNLQDGKMHYTRPLFVELFEEGGLFLIDERDAGDPNVLLSINAALSVGQLALDRPGNQLQIGTRISYACPPRTRGTTAPTGCMSVATNKTTHSRSGSPKSQWITTGN